MKKLFLLLGLLTSAVAAQELDTIFANEDYNTALFFPGEIRQGIVGSQNFIFSYNQEHPQYLGLLKALPGTPSNLLVLTQKGDIFSYVIAYKKSLSKLIYFIGEEKRLGNAIRNVNADKIARIRPEEETAGDPLRHHDSIFKRRARYYLKASSGKLKSNREKGIDFQVNEVNYYDNEVYISCELENRSGITFEPAYLRIFLVSGNKRRNASFQRLAQEPVFKYNFPEKLLHGQQVQFVFVLPKFTLGDKEKLELVLKERQGNRDLKIRLRRF